MEAATNLGRVMGRALPLLTSIALVLAACADGHYAYDRPYYDRWAFWDGCCGFDHDRIFFDHDHFDDYGRHDGYVRPAGFAEHGTWHGGWGHGFAGHGGFGGHGGGGHR